MFCQYIFNIDGKIIDKCGTIEGIDLKATTITELFSEVGIKEKEWKVGEKYFANCDGRKFECIATNLGENFQFIGVDITKHKEYKDKLESQSRISDLNMNRLLNTLEDLRESKNKIETELEEKTKLIQNTNHDIREALNSIIGITEILNDSSTDDQKELIEILATSSKNLLTLIEGYEVK